MPDIKLILAIAALALFLHLSLTSASVFHAQKITVLGMNKNGGAFSINSARIKTGFVSDQEGPYKYEILSENMKVLFSDGFSPSQNFFYDSADENGRLTGGIVKMDMTSFPLTIPYIDGGYYIRILSGNTSSLLPLPSTAEVSESSVCVDVLSSGNPADKLDIVFIGDKYNDTQNFINDIEKNKNYLLSLDPFKNNSQKINIHAVNRTTDIGCYYNCAGIQRLICCPYENVSSAASACPYDEIVVLVNNDTYGGSGGAYTVSYNGYAMPQVVVHELGHSFGQLMDEYSYGIPSGGGMPGPNCDNISSSSESIACPKWSWAQGLPYIGCYAQCTFDNFYRPTYSMCLMYTLSPGMFDAICQKQLNQQLDSYYNTVAGDVNNDCTVDIFDLASVGSCFGMPPEGGCTTADNKKDGVIDIFDLATVGKNFGRTC